MLRLSKKVDYGLMALMHLARYEAVASSSAREIAEAYDIPAGLLAKILQKLAQHGLVESQQGTKGGYRLARPAREIRAAQVIEAIDGSLSLAQCFTDQGTCLQFDKCNVKSPLQRLNDRVLHMMAGVTIAQMAQEQFGRGTISGEAHVGAERGPSRLPVLP
ncbi:MAG: RrF2 family transcriptional regulator [Acidobacteriota bacterium]